MFATLAAAHGLVTDASLQYATLRTPVAQLAAMDKLLSENRLAHPASGEDGFRLGSSHWLALDALPVCHPGVHRRMVFTRSGSRKQQTYCHSSN